MPLDRPSFIQQLRYWQGQALLSRDLNDQAAYDALLRAWHNRALHALDNGSLYGVYEGLDTLLAGTGRVEVAPGMAYDATGRVLLLRQAASVPLPGRVPRGGLILVLSNPRPARGCEAERPSDACLPGSGPSRPHIILHWVPATQFEPCDGVALAHLRAAGDLRPPPYATRILPLARPLIGSGATIPGSTAWDLWLRKKSLGQEEPAVPESPGVEPAVSEEEPVPVVEASESSGATGGGPDSIAFFVATTPPSIAVPPAPTKLIQVLGLQVEVDTSAAGFTETPCYQAWLEGGMWNPDAVDLLNPRLQQSGARTARTLALFELLQYLELRFGHVHQPTATGFTYRIWFPRLVRWADPYQMFTYLPLVRQLLLQSAQQGNLAVAWVGVQETAKPNTEIDLEDSGDCYGTT
jgi:hypothetical protein